MGVLDAYRIDEPTVIRQAVGGGNETSHGLLDAPLVAELGYGARGQSAVVRLVTPADVPVGPQPPTPDAVSSLLIWAARRMVRPAAGSPPSTSAFAPEMWPAVLRAGLQHAMLPILNRALRDEPALPDAMRSELQYAATANAARNLVMTGRLLDVLGRLRGAGITGVPWKGPLLGQRAYADIGLRSFFDLDVLVPRHQLDLAVGILEKMGFRPEKHMSERERVAYVSHQGELEMVRDSDGSWLELHWAVVPNFYAAPREADEIWSRLTEARIGRTGVSALAVEDDLEALCVHGSKHRWDRLLWILDIAMLVGSEPAIDWHMLMARARRHGTLRMTRLGLLLAVDVCGGSLPDAVLRDARRDRGAVTLAAEVQRRLFDPRANPLDRFLFHARMRERGRDVARYVTEVIYTPSGADWERVALPQVLFPLYAIARPFRLISKVVAHAGDPVADNGKREAQHRHGDPAR